MKKTPLFIPVLLGTLRKGNESQKVARYLVSRLEGMEKVKSALIDPAQMVLSREDYGPGIAGKYSEYGEIIKKADGLVIVSPEYNHGYPEIGRAHV